MTRYSHKSFISDGFQYKNLHLSLSDSKRLSLNRNIVKRKKIENFGHFAEGTVFHYAKLKFPGGHEFGIAEN